MTLTLRIDNADSLPDGGPIEFSVTERGAEIGRDPGMDWTLPDPNRFVSSCHMEIRHEGGRYMLYDVSTNGTFVNGASMRVKSPYEIQEGDRLQVGHYLIVASVRTAGLAAPGGGVAAAPSAGDIWSVGGAASDDGFDPTPPPPSRLPDFGDAHIDLPGGGAPFGAGGGAAPGGGSPFGAPPAQPPASPPAGASASPFGTPPPAAPQAPPAPQESASPFGTPPPAAPPPPPAPQEIASPFGSPPPAPSGDAAASPFGAPPAPQRPAAPPEGED
uniref:type VI secretion system-associated FHA domain protein n=1 Tax=Tropicimonas sp. IMCC34011 TaxID=2248759 RepID=UPI000E225C34